MRTRRPAAPAIEPAICNCLALRQAARHVTRFYDRYMAGQGLRPTQYSILARLARTGPLTVGRLAALIVIDRTAMGRALRPLERDKLLTLSPGRDERTRVVTLTAAGQAKAKAAATRWREAQKAFEVRYGEAEAVRLRGQLADLIAATRAHGR